MKINFFIAPSDVVTGYDFFLKFQYDIIRFEFLQKISCNMRRNKWYCFTNLCSYVLQLNFIQVCNMPCILSRMSTVYYSTAAGVTSFKWLPVWSDSGVASKYFQVIIESFEIISNALLRSFQNIFKCFTAFLYPLETRGNCIYASNIFCVHLLVIISKYILVPLY